MIKTEKYRVFTHAGEKRILFFLLFICACIPSLHAAVKNQLPRTKIALTEAEQRKFDYFFYEGLILKNAEKYDAAFDIFRYCLEIDSTASAVLYELSAFYMQLNQPEKSASLLKNAVRYNPDNFTYKLALASISFNIGMYGEAAEEYEELVRKYPDKVELNYYLAEALTQQGEIGKAIDTFDALENMMGMNEPVSMQKFRLYMTLEQPEKAFAELEKLAVKHPGNARYPLLIGNLYLERKDADNTLKYLRKAHAIDSANPYYTVAMADYYELVGNPEAAEALVRTALVDDEMDVEMKVSILARYIQQIQQSRNGTEGANALFLTLLEQHPEDIELKLMYGNLLVTQGNEEEARFQFQLATEMAPDYEQAWQQLLDLALRNQNFDDVVSICKKCLELFPRTFEYYIYLGVAYVQQEKYQDALNTYQSGLNAIPKENTTLISDFYGQIGDTYFQMKESGKAFEAYESALKYNEHNVVVLNNYSYFLSLKKKDLDKAERMSAQVVKIEPDNSTYLDTYAWIFFVKGDYLLAKTYIQKALDNDKTGSPELVDHYGDILYMTGEKEKALEQWIKAKELGKESKTLDRKIEEKAYFEETEDEE
ncbi:MAG: tetratricopeptide repeat protein [Tannerella sp.]|jgi:tetratricopeptide (TPR) repeat protein|nr:tetratricopeptide repeat protein [Tannerella sp.]